MTNEQSTEAAIHNFLEKVVPAAMNLIKTTKLIAMEHALDFVNTNDLDAKKNALSWQSRSQIYQSVTDTLLSDTMVSAEQKERFETLKNGKI